MTLIWGHWLVGWFVGRSPDLEQCTLLYNFCWVVVVVVLSAGCKEMVLLLVWGLVFPLFLLRPGAMIANIVTVVN